MNRHLDRSGAIENAAFCALSAAVVALWFVLAPVAASSAGKAAAPKNDRADSERPADTLLIRSCQMHDLDTLVRCEIVLPWDVLLVNKSIRLHAIDAFEVSKTRQTVEVTDAEIVKGKEGLAKLNSLAEGGTWFVRPTGDSVYGRLEGELFIKRKNGEWMSLAGWIRANGYERGEK